MQRLCTGCRKMCESLTTIYYRRDRTVCTNRNNKPKKIFPDTKDLFKESKEKFIKELILKIYQPKLLIRVKIDLLDFILGACLI